MFEVFFFDKNFLNTIMDNILKWIYKYPIIQYNYLLWCGTWWFGYCEFFAEDGKATVSAPYESFGAIQKWIEDMGYELVSGEGVRIPTDTKELTAEEREAVEKLQEKLEEDDDVVNVYTTMAEADEE